MTYKHLALALIPIIGASVLLWGQPSNYNLLSTNPPIVTDLLHRSTNMGYAVSNTWPPIPRYYNREVLIGGESAGPTNIVISNDYSGTIKIGSNFATTKELDTWMTVLNSMKRIETEWTWPITTNNHPLAAFTNYKRFTYTVNVADGLWTHTNVIDIHRCSEFCTRMRYVDDGLTNDFHAAFASFTVKTNAP